MADVLLAYKREGEDCIGFIEYENGNLHPAVILDGVPFHKMIAQLSRVLKERPEDRCVFRRLERNDLNDFVLDEQFTNLIRTDPLTAVKMMTFETKPVDLKKLKPKTQLIVAYDALAETFGDLVYIRREGKYVECPFCGEWANYIDTDVQGLGCSGCGLTAQVKDTSPEWAGVEVDYLLLTGVEKLFLPRRWNEHGNWITRDDLARKHEEFLKESEDVRSNTR